jgi:DNA-binding SARP family transcriptional activator
MAYTLRTFGGLHVEGPGGPLRGAAAQRRSLALLVVVAVASDRGVSRDTLAAMLWPESDEERARRALAQTLYRVRQELGSELVQGGDRLRLNPALLNVDVLQLEAAIERGDRERAVELYHGPFLEGFYVPNAPEFERWADGERRRFAQLYLETLERLATSADAAGAVRWWQLAAAADPVNARLAARLIRARGAAGDAAGALQAARVYESLVRQELDADPDPSVLAAVAAVRAELALPARAGADATPPSPNPVNDEHATAARAAVAPYPAPASAAPPPPAAGGARQTSDAPRATGWRRVLATRRAITLAVLAGLAVVVAGTAAVAAALRQHDATVPPVLAVGQIVDLTGGDTAGVARVLPELLTTSLGRFDALRVVSRPRLYELASQLESPRDGTGFDRAAAEAGAELLLDGMLYRRQDGELRLDLRLMNLEQHIIRRAYRLEGDDPFALADSAASRVADELGVSPPVPGSAPGVTSRSLVALQLYEEGLQTFYAGDQSSAERFFAAALDKDTTFAMAAYYAFKSAFSNNDRALPYLRQALRLSTYATERERLIIRATWAAANYEPERLVFAESLSTRYPADPKSHVLLGDALIMSGDFDGAVLAYHQALGMDPKGLPDGAGFCVACDAMHGLVKAYLHADSLESAERVAREYTHRQPSSADAWLELATVLAIENDTAGAAAAFRRRTALVPYAPEEMPLMVTVALRAGDFERAHRLLTSARASESEGTRTEALWWLTIALRYEGRLDDALRTVTALKRVVGTDASVRHLYGQVLLELGRPRDAEAVFAAVERDWRAAPAAMAGLHSRRLAWAMAHRVSALAAAGDTAALARLIEPLQKVGARSGYGRDPRLHHYARGLLLEARGHREEAVAELREAIYSPSLGYTRVNYDLGRLYLELDRPYDAIHVLRPALHGSIEASNLYITHTELHALLARAFAATGAADSAAAHQAYVERALANADAHGRAWILGQVGRN